MSENEQVDPPRLNPIGVWKDAVDTLYEEFAALEKENDDNINDYNALVVRYNELLKTSEKRGKEIADLRECVVDRTMRVESLNEAIVYCGYALGVLGLAAVIECGVICADEVTTPQPRPGMPVGRGAANEGGDMNYDRTPARATEASRHMHDAPRLGGKAVCPRHAGPADGVRDDGQAGDMA